MSIINIQDIYKSDTEAVAEQMLDRINENQNPATPLSTIFENRVWLFFKNFDKKISILSRKTNKTKILFGKNESQQIDVFAVSESLTFVCEVTTQEVMSEKLEDMIGWKTKLQENGIENHIQKDPNMDLSDTSFIWLLFSKHDISPALKEKADNYDILILTEDDVSYVEQVIDSYGTKKSLAFVPFLSNVLDMQLPISSMIEVSAIRYYYQNSTFCYSFIAHPGDLLDRCTVIHRRSEKKMDKSYQRFIDTTKINKVTKFINANPQFSNNIILSSEWLKLSNVSFKKTSEQASVKAGKDDTAHPPELGILTLPNFFGDMSVIDGQHRLFGYSGSSKEYSHFVNCLLFDSSLERKDQQVLFKNINENQKALTSNHIWELNEDTLPSGHRKQKISTFFNKYLNSEATGFRLFGRIKMGNTIHRRGKGDIKLSYTNVGNAMATYRRDKESVDLTLFEYLESLFMHDPKAHYKIMEIFNGFLKVFEESCEDDLNVNSKGLILTGSTFVALMYIFREILFVWDQNGELKEKIKDRINIDQHFKKYLDPICQFVNEFKTPSEKTEWKSSVLGSGGPKAAANLLVREIHKRDSSLKEFGKMLLTESVYSPEYDYINEILLAKDEVVDIEAKSEIFIRNLPKKQQLSEARSSLLAHIGAMHHVIGGFLVVGLDPIDYHTIGCDKELDEHGGFGKWRDKVQGLITSCSRDKIVVDITREIIDDKTIIFIRIPMMSDDDLKNQNWVKWYTDSGRTNWKLKIRKPGESVEFQEIGTDKEVQEYIIKIRDQIVENGDFINSMVLYEQKRKEENLDVVSMYNSFLRLKY